MTNRQLDTLAQLERLAPGTPLRQGLERVIQSGKGALILIGGGSEAAAITSGGFWLRKTPFSTARVAELAKMDGGIILDDEVEQILAANVHFHPDNSIPTDETGARHRTAERVSAHLGRPVVAVSEGRRVATLFIGHEKIELASPTEVGARVNQELQTLDRLRRRLDEAENQLTLLEVAALVTFRSVVVLVQRAELVRRVGRVVETDAITLGEEGRLASLQLLDLMRGVEHLRNVTLRDYVRPRRSSLVRNAITNLEALTDSDLEDPVMVGRALGFPDLDATAAPRGYRMVGRVNRLPEPVRNELVRHFRSFDRLLRAPADELEKVEGIGSARAEQLRHYFDRLLGAARDWAPDLG